MRAKLNTRKTARDSVQEGRRTIVLGTGPLAQKVVHAIREHGSGSYELVGAVSESESMRIDEEKFGCKVLGSFARLEKILAAYKTDNIIVAVVDGKMEIMERLLLFLLHSNASVRPAVEVYEELTGQVPIDTLTPDDFVFGHEVRPRVWPVFFNRMISVIIAATGVVLTAPLMAIIALAVRLDSDGPAIYVQDRAGLDGRRFRLFKFRTMRFDTPERSVWAAENADRITRSGELLRRFRLDELPQLFNVLKGDMNIVGPRPHPSPSSELVELISRNVAECGVAMPYYSMRSMVRPGITGWAQVRYKYANGLREEMEKLRYDLYYVKHYSIWLDLRILMMTFFVMAGGSGNGRSSESAAPVSSGSTSPSHAQVLPMANRVEEVEAATASDGTPVRALHSAEGERRSGAWQ